MEEAITRIRKPISRALLAPLSQYSVSSPNPNPASMNLSTLLPPNPNLLPNPNKNPTGTPKPINPILSSKPEPIEIRVCVNRSCSRQGSRSILELLSSVAPPSVSVSSCGCLGRCGAGPNLVMVPRGEILGHCGTPARAARVLEDVCGGVFDAGRSLEAVALRRKAEEEIEMGNFDEAEALLSKAIELEPSGGLHFIYGCRSAARLGRGNNEGALQDAEEACRIAPRFPQAYICQGDAFMAMEEWAAAENMYSNALLVDPSIRRSRSFKARVAKLQEKLILSDASS